MDSKLENLENIQIEDQIQNPLSKANQLEQDLLAIESLPNSENQNSQQDILAEIKFDPEKDQQDQNSLQGSILEQSRNPSSAVQEKINEHFPSSEDSSSSPETNLEHDTGKEVSEHSSKVEEEKKENPVVIEEKALLPAVELKVNTLADMEKDFPVDELFLQ